MLNVKLVVVLLVFWAVVTHTRYIFRSDRAIDSCSGVKCPNGTNVCTQTVKTNPENSTLHDVSITCRNGTEILKTVNKTIVGDCPFMIEIQYVHAKYDI